MLPVGEDAIIPIKTHDYLQIFSLTLKLAVPAAYFWLTMFYCVFHSYLNLWAELTSFADRRFYSDWWNANDLGEYWRKWNQPIHNFLIRHVYYPSRRKGIPQTYCLMITFTPSAAFHEYILAGIIGRVNGVGFNLMMVNIPAMFLQRYLKNTVSGTLNNILFWLCYIILGQPLGILYSYY